MPVASQRSSIAPAILPQPTSQNGPGSAGTLISGFALRLDQGGGDGFGGGLVGPEHELEDGVEAFAFLDRGFDQRLGLLHRQRAALLAFQQRGVAEEAEARSEERRVGKECVSTCRSRVSPCN